MTAARNGAVDVDSALTGDDCCRSEGAQHGFSAQHPAQVTAGQVPGIWQEAGIASSGCETVATISSKIISGFFTKL